MVPTLTGEILHAVLDGRDLTNVFAVVLAEDALTVRLLENHSQPAPDATGPVEFGLEQPALPVPARAPDQDEVHVARKCPLPWGPGAVVAEIGPEPRWRFRIRDRQPHPYRTLSSSPDPTPSPRAPFSGAALRRGDGSRA